MKIKPSLFVKNIMSVLSNAVMGKITGIKSKAQAIRVRILVFSLLKNKDVSLSHISNKIQSLLDRKNNNEIDNENDSRAIVLYEGNANDDDYYYYRNCEEHYYDKYPDQTHSLFEEDDEGIEGLDDDPEGSVIDMVKNSKENDGKEFKLENEIDHVADLFIGRFRRQIRLQKLESFKRLQEMIGRTA